MSIQTRLLTVQTIMLSGAWNKMKGKFPDTVWNVTCPRRLLSSHASLLIGLLRLFIHISAASYSILLLSNTFFLVSIFPSDSKFHPFVPSHSVYIQPVFLFISSERCKSAFPRCRKECKKWLWNKSYKRPPRPKLECDDIQMNSKQTVANNHK